MKTPLCASVMALFMVLILFPSSVFCQKKALTLEDLYDKNTYATKGYGPLKWYKEGYTTLEPSSNGEGKDIVYYRLPKGEREILVSSSSLKPDQSSDPLWISNYQWSDDGSYLLIFTNTKRVWRYHTIGDFWVLDLKKNQLSQLGSGFPPSSLQFAKVAPGGKQVAYVQGYNIYVEDLNTGAITPLTRDGGGHIINGTFDWAYEEEFQIRDGFRWDPSGTRIAFWQINTEGVGTFHLINTIDSIYPSIHSFAYPKVGTTNPEARIGVVDVETGKTTWMDIPGDKRNNYLPRMDWASGGDELVIQQIPRRQTTNHLILADAGSGESRIIFTEKVEDVWLEAYNDLTWFEKGKYFTWASDRTAWMHLYRVSRDGQDIQAVTRGDFEVIRLTSIDEKGGYAYFIASPENPTQRYLYRAKLNGKGEIEQVTPGGQPGHHAYNVSPDNQYAIHTYSSHDTPPVIELIRLKDHQTIRVLEGNEELNNQLDGLDIRMKEFFRLSMDDGMELDGWMIKPPDFDPAQKYPVIFYVYGEPHGSTVQDQWSGRDFWHYLLAQEGYLVVSVDNRGTGVPRGREWRKSVYKQIGIQASIDQGEAAKKILEWDFVDPERIGVWGASGGGSMTLNCMFRYPEIFKTGIALSFIADQKLYDSFYQERFMGLLEENEYGYREGSPITHAQNLEGNLMLIYGSGDDNCHYQNLEMLVDKLIKHNKFFTMIEYPMRTHSLRERENTRLHLRTSMYNYFRKNLPAGGN